MVEVFGNGGRILGMRLPRFVQKHLNSEKPAIAGFLVSTVTEVTAGNMKSAEALVTLATEKPLCCFTLASALVVVAESFFKSYSRMRGNFKPCFFLPAYVSSIPTQNMCHLLQTSISAAVTSTYEPAMLRNRMWNSCDLMCFL